LRGAALGSSKSPHSSDTLAAVLLAMVAEAEGSQEAVVVWVCLVVDVIDCQ
jgi:hypothetical protein